MSPSSRTSANGSFTIRDRGVDELFRALVHKARVRTEHQYDRLRWIGARDEGVGVLIFDRDHRENLSDRPDEMK